MILDKLLGGTLNGIFEDLEPWKISVLSCLSTLLGVLLVNFLFQDESLALRGKKFALRHARRIPAVRNRIAREFTDTKHRLEQDLTKHTKSLRSITQLSESKSAEEVLALIKKYKQTESAQWNKLSGTVYSGSDDITKLSTSVYELFAWSNPLHPDVFPSVRQMEAEVVRMVCTMFNGDSDSCGSMTSGGTESLLLACKTYRDYAISRGIKKPIIIAPVTAHAAFDKAAEYLAVGIRKIPFDPTTFKVDLRAMERAITSRACVLVASAPHFPHGIIDPIPEIAALGLKYDIPVHVDSCLGGFLLPFMDKAGYPLDAFDFRLKGVTSISADTHKYGYAPKGSSVILYRSHKYIHHQYSVAPDWPGGIYASPSISGSRVGASIATAWATMLYVGENGYVQATKEIISTARKIAVGLRSIEHIYVLGDPQVSVIAMGSKDFNIYRLSDALAARGWNLNALQYPSSIHFCVTRRHTEGGVVEKFLSDVETCVEEVAALPAGKESGMAAIYGMAQSIPDRSVVSEMAWAYLDSCVSLPDRKD